MSLALFFVKRYQFLKTLKTQMRRFFNNFGHTLHILYFFTNSDSFLLVIQRRRSLFVGFYGNVGGKVEEWVYDKTETRVFQIKLNF